MSSKLKRVGGRRFTIVSRGSWNAWLYSLQGSGILRGYCWPAHAAPEQAASKCPFCPPKRSATLHWTRGLATLLSLIMIPTLSSKGEENYARIGHAPQLEYSCTMTPKGIWYFIAEGAPAIKPIYLACFSNGMQNAKSSSRFCPQNIQHILGLLDRLHCSKDMARSTWWYFYSLWEWHQLQHHKSYHVAYLAGIIQAIQQGSSRTYLHDCTD